MKIRGINIIADPAFHNANLMLKHVCNAFLRKGGRISSFQAIDPQDLQKLALYFTRSSPRILLEEVYFNTLFYFGNRGREWQRGLTAECFVEKRLAGGQAAVALLQGSSKNVHGSTSIRQMVDCKEALMVERSESEKCPVAALRLYRSKIGEVPGWNGRDFFLKPRRAFQVSFNEILLLYMCTVQCTSVHNDIRSTFNVHY